MKVQSDSDVDSDIVSNIEEQKQWDIEKEEETLIPKDWAGQVEEEESKPREDLFVDTEQKETVLSTGEALREEFKKGRGQDREKRICQGPEVMARPQAQEGAGPVCLGGR